MSNDPITPPYAHRPRQYQIRVGGRLSPGWSEWFDGLAITATENDETLITGWVADQSALQGLLKKVRDLGLPLLSVNPVEPTAPDTSATAHDSSSPKE